MWIRNVYKYDRFHVSDDLNIFLLTYLILAPTFFTLFSLSWLSGFSASVSSDQHRNCPYPQVHVLNNKPKCLPHYFSRLAVVERHECVTSISTNHITLELCLQEPYFKSLFDLSFQNAVLSVILFLPFCPHHGYDNSIPPSFLSLEVCFSFSQMQSHRKLCTPCQRRE